MVVLSLTVALLMVSLFFVYGVIEEYRASHEILWKFVGFALLFLCLGISWPFLF